MSALPRPGHAEHFGNAASGLAFLHRQVCHAQKSENRIVHLSKNNEKGKLIIENIQIPREKIAFIGIKRAHIADTE